MRYCPSCGTAIPQVAAFCPNCGQALGPRPETPPPRTPAFAGPTPAAARPAYPSDGGYPAPGAGIPAPGGLARSGIRWLIVLIALAAVFFFFIRPRLPKPGLNVGPSVRGATPTFGSVRELVPPQVGRFTQEITTSIPDAGSEGATDGIGASYRSPDGPTVYLFVMAFPDAAAANRRLTERRKEFADAGVRMTTEEPFRNRQGQQVGTRAVSQGPSGSVLWTDGNLFCMVLAPVDIAVEFQQALPF